MAEYLRGVTALWAQHGYSGAWYGHFGQGCVHTRNNFDLGSREGLRQYRSYVTAAAELVVSLGGSLSGEHGDGQSRGELLEVMFGPDLVEGFGEFKALWDPDGLMNPGKVVRSLPPRLEHPLFEPARAGQPAPHGLCLRQGRGFAHACCAALRGRRPVPAGRRRHHVPVVPGDPRRSPFHPRSGQDPDRDVPDRDGARGDLDGWERACFLA